MNRRNLFKSIFGISVASKIPVTDIVPIITTEAKIVTSSFNYDAITKLSLDNYRKTLVADIMRSNLLYTELKNSSKENTYYSRG